MIVASGVLEIKDSRSLNVIVDELKARSISIVDVEECQVRFQIERKTIGEVRDEMESFRQLDGVNNLHITYYSLEHIGNNNEFKDE